MAESIERLLGELPDIPGRLHLLLGGMAAQLVRKDEAVPDPMEGKNTYDHFLLNRMRIIGAYSASDFAVLMTHHMNGREKLSHLFNIEFSDEGLVTLPKGGLAGGLPPARFPVHYAISNLAKELGRRHDEPGR
ncbi:hypothetical protein [Nitrosomonas communis]|uniref:hypothetical protein n=1 Tax=Nitrosomonas communis TaxID=44574 RepID=UPI003D2A9A96